MTEGYRQPIVELEAPKPEAPAGRLRRLGRLAGRAVIAFGHSQVGGYRPGIAPVLKTPEINKDTE